LGGAQSKKEADEAAERELNDLFAQAIKQPKVPPGEAGLPSWHPVCERAGGQASNLGPNHRLLGAGVDPKSVVCEYFRQGRCSKGHKCKYSHDLNVERKGGKIDLFTERYCFSVPPGGAPSCTLTKPAPSGDQRV
jgi:hypothetical protein